jgi:hypothetical protein
VDHRHSLASWSDEELEELIEAKNQLMASGYKPELAAGQVVEGEVVVAQDDLP